MTPKEYRKAMGFTNKGNFKKYLGAKDIVEPNWTLIEKKNQRLIQQFESLIDVLKIKEPFDVADTVHTTTQIIKDNDILKSLNNHGRAIENVYYSWLQGYLAELTFTPLIKHSLGLNNIERNGGDDLSNIDAFKRTGDADLVDHTAKVMIDVQAGVTGGSLDIKQHKVKNACANDDYESYVFFADMCNGTYANIALKPLINETFVANPQWEGQLVYTVDPDLFKPFC